MSYTEAFAHKRFYTQMLLNTHTHTLSHTNAFTHRLLYTQRLLHADAFTHTHTFIHRGFYTQKLLKSVSIWHFMVLNSNCSVFDIKHMMASSSVANVCRHFASEVLSHVWFTASWYRSFLSHLCGLSIKKWNNMCHTRHHGTELFWAIYVGFSILKWNNMCHTRHHGTEHFLIVSVVYSQNKMRYRVDLCLCKRSQTFH